MLGRDKIAKQWAGNDRERERGGSSEREREEISSGSAAASSLLPPASFDRVKGAEHERIQKERVELIIPENFRRKKKKKYCLKRWASQAGCCPLPPRPPAQEDYSIMLLMTTDNEGDATSVTLNNSIIRAFASTALNVCMCMYFLRLLMSLTLKNTLLQTEGCKTGEIK